MKLLKSIKNGIRWLLSLRNREKTSEISPKSEMIVVYLHREKHNQYE